MKKYLCLISILTVVMYFEIQGQATIDSTNDSIFVLDAHSHHGFPKLEETDIDSDMAYLKNLGYNAIVFLLPQDRTNTNELLVEDIAEDIQSIRQLSIQGNSFHVFESSKELEANLDSDKISCLFAIEYFHGIFDDSLSVIQKYKDLGIEYITLINNEHDELFMSSKGSSKLTDFGKNVIKKMNDLDLKIDISHLTEGEMLEVINYSKVPIIASHANAKQIASLDYNLTNEVLEALKRNHGLVLVSFNTNGLYSKDNHIKAEIEQLADHIDYIKSVIGINLVGIGSDFQAYGKYVPSGLTKKETFIELKDLLIERDYSLTEIELIFFRNYLNFMK
ncbi:dipeptidase [Lentimicrobium sp. S6]|uniref:dipeptidase n=1 Tax=Lentimicrobium sp. S6 TaxID=2735872 RepID=UPI00155668AB|nr:membrane dipeptidase [Lentimicrobium sp. S6]NPD47287.1 hypothetical protein [Lentimicrobium sp. S6]